MSGLTLIHDGVVVAVCVAEEVKETVDDIARVLLAGKVANFPGREMSRDEMQIRRRHQQRHWSYMRRKLRGFLPQHRRNMEVGCQEVIS